MFKQQLPRWLISLFLLTVGIVSWLLGGVQRNHSAEPQPLSAPFSLFSSNKEIAQDRGSPDLASGLATFAPRWSLGIFPKGASSFLQITMLRAIYEATNETVDWTAVESKKDRIHLLRPVEFLRDWPSSLFIPFFHLGGAYFGLYGQEEKLRKRIHSQLQPPYPHNIVSTFRDPREQAVSLHSWMNQSLPALRRKTLVGTAFWQLVVQYQALGGALMNSADFQNHSDLVVLNSHLFSTQCTRLMQIAFRMAEMNFIVVQDIQRACLWSLSRGRGFSKIKSSGLMWHQHPLAWEMSCVAEQLIGSPFVHWIDWWAYTGDSKASECTLAVATAMFQNYTLWLQ